MNIREELSSLSHWVYCWFISITIAWLLSFIWMWQFSLSCLLFLIPFCIFLRWWNKNRIYCSLNHVLKPFLHGFINIPLLAIVGQFIGLIIITAIFIAIRLLTFSIGNFLFILICITYYVAIEEVLKLWFSLKSRDSVQDPINQITKTHTITSTATGLGYSMCQGIIWTIFAAFQLNKDDQKDGDKYSLFGWLFLITFILAVIGMPMHLITGYVMGCKITKRDIDFAERADDDIINEHNRLPFKSYLNVTYFGIFIRSSYLFFLVIGFLVLQFNIGGAIIALLGIIVDYYVLIKYTKKVESQLPFDYLQRAGQLSIFGYNILHDQPINEYENDNNGINGDDNNNLMYNNESNIQITAVSLDNYKGDLDEPMMIISNKNNKQNDENDDEEEEMQYKSCNLNEDVEIHVRDDILDQDDDENSSDHDTHSTVR